MPLPGLLVVILSIVNTSPLEIFFLATIERLATILFFRS